MHLPALFVAAAPWPHCWSVHSTTNVVLATQILMPRRQEATFLRTALLLGLRNGEDAVAWADARLHSESDPPPALVEVALTPPSDLSALRIALEPLAEEPVAEATVRAILREAALALSGGRRSVSDSVHLFRQMRSMLPLTADLDEVLDGFVDAHMLAQVGIGPTVEEVELRIRTWMESRRHEDPPAAA